MVCVRVLVLLILIVLTATGCAPRVRVTASPGPHDQGIRYYRPKPYLLVKPSGQTVTDSKRNVTVTPSDEFVQISLEYLPDFSEEYSINVSPGLGTANVQVGLEDGWNLTSLNQNLDAKFDDNVKAIADLAKSTAGFITTGADAKTESRGATPGSTQKFVVPATNVPIGYYESVIDADACGKKRLLGWRYVGFVPFATCPIESCGNSQSLDCASLPSQLFGIVFRNGAMQFCRLDQIDQDSPISKERNEVSHGQYQVPPPQASQLKALQRGVRMAVLKNYGIESQVDVVSADDDIIRVDVSLTAELDKSIDKSKFVKDLMRAEDIEDVLADMGDPLLSFGDVVVPPPVETR